MSPSEWDIEGVDPGRIRAVIYCQSPSPCKLVIHSSYTMFNNSVELKCRLRDIIHSQMGLKFSNQLGGTVVANV